MHDRQPLPTRNFPTTEMRVGAVWLDSHLSYPGRTHLTRLVAFSYVIRLAADAFLVADNDNTGDAEDEAEEEFRLRCSRRARQAREAWADSSHCVDMTLALWSSEPLDRLSSVLQHREEHGKATLDAIHEAGPIHEAERELWRRATSAETCFFPLTFLRRHFDGHAEVDAEEVMRSGFAKAVDMAAQLWSRLRLKYTCYPWRLLALVDSRTPEHAKVELRRDFATCPACELDQTFSAPLRASLADPEQVDVEAGDCLTALARGTRMTNMHIERLLSQVKKASPTVARKPTVERFCAAGLLSQHMSRFTKRGYEDKHMPEQLALRLSTLPPPQPPSLRPTPVRAHLRCTCRCSNWHTMFVDAAR